MSPALLRSIPAFKDMPETRLNDLVRASEERAYEAGAKLMGQGEESSFALILMKGDVSIVNERATGAFPVATLHAPALFGEIGTLSDLPRTATAIAQSDVVVLRVPRTALIAALQSAPEALNAVTRQLGQQIRNLNVALGLYADGFRALERGALDDDLAHDLGRVSPELQNFSEAFAQLARRVSLERRMRADMASAALIQREMLPHIEALSLPPRCEAFGGMKPAKDVGGDFYDIFMLDDARVAFCIGDVCGKGVPASLFMCVTMTTLRLVAREPIPLAEMMTKANALLFAQNAAGMFATLFFAVLDVGSGALTYVNCGHNPPFLIRRDGAPAPLSSGGLPLGIVPHKSWPAHETHLGRDEVLFLFTDGVTEAMDAREGEYGEERLRDVLSNATGQGAEALVQAVERDVAAFAEGAEQSDDITCLAVILRG